MPQVINSHVLTDRNPFINYLRAVNTWLCDFIYTVPGRHAKHVLSFQFNTTNHENWPRPESSIFIKTRASKKTGKWVIRLKNKVRKHVLIFAMFSLNLCFALTFQHLPRDLANVNEWEIMFDLLMPQVKCGFSGCSGYFCHYLVGKWLSM